MIASRGYLPYALLLILGAALYLLFPDQLPLFSRIAIMAIFVMSLDLVVGYAGLATLGHAALFGAGAYAAGLTALHGTPDPLLGLLAGAGAGTLVALISGPFILRYQGLTFLMLSIAVSQILGNLASKLRGWTGGDDGLTGFANSAVLGIARFDLYGKVAFLYSGAALLLCLFILRRMMASPFGQSCIGIHQNRMRMAAMGTDIRGQLIRLYAVSGCFAGLAGALSAQTNQIVGLDSLGFELSAEALVMLVLGGAGSLYGAIGGAALFMTIHHFASTMNPYHWLFIIGGLLVLVVLAPRDRLLSAIGRKLSSLLGSGVLRADAPGNRPGTSS